MKLTVLITLQAVLLLLVRAKNKKAGMPFWDNASFYSLFLKDVQ
jgi:hypothetical protein